MLSGAMLTVYPATPESTIILITKYERKKCEKVSEMDKIEVLASRTFKKCRVQPTVRLIFGYGRELEIGNCL
jgi:hypothetical protein